MPDYYITVTAEQSIENVSREEAEQLAKLLGIPASPPLREIDEGKAYGNTHDCSGCAIEWYAPTKELYIFADMHADFDFVPAAFWDGIGRLLKERKMAYLEFGWAAHCSKPCPGSHGGGEFRVYDDGSVVYAQPVYPRRKKKKLRRTTKKRNE